MRKRNKTKLKCAFTLILCLLFSLSFLSCGDNKNEDNIKTADIKKLQENMLSAATELPDMSTVNSNTEDAEELFAYLSDLKYDKVDSYFLSYANSAVADEIAVICLKEKEDVQEAADSLKKHIEERTALFSAYAPEETLRLDKAMIFSEGKYAVLIVCEQPQAVKDAFYESIEQ